MTNELKNMPYIIDTLLDEAITDSTRQKVKDKLTEFCQLAINALGQRWIPVTERLPKKCEYGEVLVTYIPSGGTLWATVIIAHYSDLMGIAKPSFHIGEVGKGSFQNITKQVIAWMPLPAPYKAESEDSE